MTRWAMAGQVHVVVAVSQTTAQIVTQFNAQPVTGRMGIFQKPKTETKEITKAEVVGAYSTEDAAAAAVDAHRAANRGVQLEYVTTLVDIDGGGNPLLPAQPAGCIMCGTPLADGTSYCQPCREKMWADMRAADPEIPEPDAAAPAAVERLKPHRIQ